MRMLRHLVLVMCVISLMSFASGCGGGGGGGATTPPGVTEPEPTQPTEAQRIATARNTLANIVLSARSAALDVQSSASFIANSQDATVSQVTSAGEYNSAAQSALVDAEGAEDSGIAATTLAQIELAISSARSAASRITSARSSISSIETSVRAVEAQRRQRAADELAQTGGSSLIKHLRDNKKVSDAVLSGLAPATSLLVGQTGTGTGSATYPVHKGDPATQFPIPRNTDRGVLGVTVSVGTTPVSSNSQTGKISGTGRLSNGFDLKDGGNFATVYTDIEVAQRVRQKDGTDNLTNDALEDTTVGDSDNGIDERYQYIADDDYLLAGIWLDDSATDGTAPVLRAFAFGSQSLTVSPDFCTAADVDDTDTLTRVCGNADGRAFNTIAGFVDENESTEATYRGGVNGAYFAGGKASHFKADVSLTATFVRGSGTNFAGSKISGEITNISAGGNSVKGSIDLKEQSLATLTNGLSDPFDGGQAAGVIEGHAYTGNWKGQFFGMRARRLTPVTTGTVADNNRRTTTTYTPDKPGSVAGSFFVERQTVGEGNAAFIGAFGAHR